jgi:hypothetical protein
VKDLFRGVQANYYCIFVHLQSYKCMLQFEDDGAGDESSPVSALGAKKKATRRTQLA